MLKDIMANKLTEERFYSKRILYLQRIQRLPSLTESQFMGYPLIDLDKQMVHKLVRLCETRLLCASKDF